MSNFFKGVIAGVGLATGALWRDASAIAAMAAPVTAGGLYDLGRAFRRGPNMPEEQYVSSLTKGLIVGVALLFFMKNIVQAYTGGDANHALRTAFWLSLAIGWAGHVYEISTTAYQALTARPRA